MLHDIKKRSAAVLAALTLLISAAGCSSEDSSSQRESNSSSAQATASTTTAATAATSPAPAVTTSAPVEPIISEAAKVYDGIEIKGNVSVICGLNGNTAALLCPGMDSQTCYIFDAASGTITRSVTTETYSDDLLGSFSDNTIVFKNNDTGKIYMIPPESDTPEEFDLDTENSVQITADRKTDCIYWIDKNGKEIRKADRSGNVSTLLSSDSISYIDSFSTEDMTASTAGYIDKDQSIAANSIYSIENGRFLAYYKDQGQIRLRTSQGCVNAVTCDPLDSFTPVYFDLFDPADGNYSGSYVYSINNGTFFTAFGHHRSDAVLINVFETEGRGNALQQLALDVRTGKLADTGLISGDRISHIESCYLEDTGCWLTALITYDGENTLTKLVLQNPQALTYDETLDRQNRDDVVPKAYTCGEKFSEVRKKADEIENKYGVKLLVGDEVLNISGLGDRNKLTSTEENTEPETIVNEIKNLNKLDVIMSAFPKNFFSHFRNEKGKGGLCIAMTDKHNVKEGSSFVPGGQTSHDGIWYNISMDSYMIHDNATFYHELWHAAETLVSEKNELSEDKWQALNPTGFTYLNEIEKYATSTETDPNTLNIIAVELEIRYDVPYFVTDYSKVNPMEDRATIIESVFQWAYARFEKTSDAYAELSKYPHIKAKIDFLAEFSKQEFGYVYWEEMLL